MNETRLHEAEAITLGIAIRSHPVAAMLFSVLDERMFHRPSHRLIARAIENALEESVTVDPLTIYSLLEMSGDLKQIGGRHAFDQILEAGNCLTSVAGFYAKQVHQGFKLREIKRIVAQDKDALDLAAELAPIIESVADFQAPPKEAADCLREEARKVIPSGFEIIDENGGGYPHGTLSAIIAPTGVGKSIIMPQSALFAARQGYRVMYATLGDLNEREVSSRFMRQICGWDHEPESPSQLGPWIDGQEELRSYRITIHDGCRDKRKKTIESVKASMRSAQERFGALDIVFIDYAQLIRRREPSRDRFADFEQTCDDLFDLADQMNVAVVVGSQATNREGSLVTKNGTRLGENSALILEADRIKQENAYKWAEELRGMERLRSLVVRKSRYGDDTGEGVYQLQTRNLKLKQVL